MKKILFLFSIIVSVIFSGCSSKNQDRTMNLKSKLNKEYLPNKTLKLKVNEVNVEAVSAGAWWILYPYAAMAKGYSKLSRNILAKETIENELIKTKNVALVKENADFTLDFEFASLKNSDYNFLSTITITDKDNANIFTKDYDAFPSSLVNDSDKLLESAFRNLIRQFVHDKEALIAMKSFDSDLIMTRNNTRNKNTINQNELSSIFSNYKFKKSNTKNYDSFALVIGINKYKMNTPVEYADYSALAFKKLSTTTLGIPEENVITILNDDATSGQIKAKIELIKELSDSKGNIYIYFAGHGVPGKDGNTYLLPYDMTADSIHLEQNLKLDNIYTKLSTSKAKNVFVFMDSCFSGKDDKGSLLYKGVAPVLKTKKTIVSNKKLAIFTAGQSSDFANDYKEKKQRLFSYFLINALAKGGNNLKQIYPKIKTQVKRKSLIKGLGYKQVPQIYGNSDLVVY